MSLVRPTIGAAALLAGPHRSKLLLEPDCSVEHDRVNGFVNRSQLVVSNFSPSLRDVVR